MRHFLASTCVSLVIVLLSGLPIIQAADRQPNDVEVAAKMQAGNQAMKAGSLQDALDAYREAATLDPDNEVAIYNQAVALYRFGDFAKAAELFQRVAASENAAIAAKARFNLGNTAYAQALASVEESPERAAEDLRRAITAYRQGLLLNRDDDDARTNIELAAKLLQQLQAQQEEQQQNDEERREEQPSPESEHQDGEQEEDGGDGQDAGDQQTQEDTDDAPQQGDEPQTSNETDDSSGSAEENASESDDPHDGESQEPSPSNESMPPEDTDRPDQTGQAGSDSSPSDSSPPIDETAGDQLDDEGHPQQEPDNGQLDQPPPADLSEEQDPTGQLAAPNQDNELKEQAGQAFLEDSATMTIEEAQKMLQAIRDRDMLRRLHRQQMERSRRIPVEKDW